MKSSGATFCKISGVTPYGARSFNIRSFVIAIEPEAVLRRSTHSLIHFSVNRISRTFPGSISCKSVLKPSILAVGAASEISSFELDASEEI